MGHVVKRRGRRQPSRWRFFFLALAIGIISFALFVLLPAFESPRSRVYAGALGRPAMRRLLGRPIEVETERVTIRSMVKTISAEGSLSYLNEVPVKSEVLGIVTAILAEPGQAVHKGDVLLRINPGGHILRLDELNRELHEWDYKQAGTNWQRAQQLYQTKAISPAELELVRQRLEHAKTALSLAEEQYKQALWSRSKSVNGQLPPGGKRGPLDADVEILATISGTVFERDVQPGENVLAMVGQKNLMVIGDRLTFRAQFDQRYASALALGDWGKFYLKAYPGIPFDGEVLRVAHEVAPEHANREGLGTSVFPNTFSVWVSLPVDSLPGTKLVKGMNGYCLFEKPFTAPAIPESALMRYSGRTGTVLTVDDTNHLQVKEVTYTGADDGWVAIERGLTEGERVVVSGQAALLPGDEVTIREE
jgi:multidrug efflux pump subunit AcrA (membrane-fusion protein)